MPPRPNLMGILPSRKLTLRTSGPVYLLLCRLIAAQLRRVGVGGRARPEYPAHHDAENEDPGDVQEVSRGRHQVRPRVVSDWRRSRSRWTTLSRRATERM